MGVDVVSFLQRKMQSSDPGMSEKWKKLHDSYQSRLWHELTKALLNFVHEPALQQNKGLIELYQNFIQEIERRIKPISFVEMAAVIVNQYDSPTEALQFLNQCEKRMESEKIRMDPLALALCKILRGTIMLDKQVDVPKLKDLLEEVDEILKVQIDGVTEVHGRFYQLQSKYSMATGDLTEYYKSALKFLGCTPLHKLTIKEQHEHAKMLAVSALVADDIYNFGELISHPILHSLTRTSDEWLVFLLKAANSGNVKEFTALNKKMSTNPLLVANESKLRVKVILTAIMELAFKKPSHQRLLSFKDIALATGVNMNEVEGFVMKAISKELVGGTIDQVDQKVYITWVKPRVLDISQIERMGTRLDEWQKEIIHAQSMVKATNKDVSCTSSTVVL